MRASKLLTWNGFKEMYLLLGAEENKDCYLVLNPKEEYHTFFSKEGAESYYIQNIFLAYDFLSGKEKRFLRLACKKGRMVFEFNSINSYTIYANGASLTVCKHSGISVYDAIDFLEKTFEGND